MSQAAAEISIYHVDAFAERPFEGNPAAICVLHEERSDDWMQFVASEMNLSETAFLRQLDKGFELRWFTPAIEVDLCGHATLASAHVLWSEGLVGEHEPIRFHTRSGVLSCNRADSMIELDFPATFVNECEPSHRLLAALGNVQAAFSGRSRFDDFVVLDSEDVVRALKPDFAALREATKVRGVIVTSASNDPRFDFVSRFFAPGCGIDEDSVTGSAHCSLAPFWAQRLHKSSMTGFQASRRGGIVRVRVMNDRVVLGGRAITIAKGMLLNS